MDNWEITGKSLTHLQSGLLPFVSDKMTQRYGNQWRHAIGNNH
ncbi:MAG TPA: hypothetical protein VEP50_01890 [bacterium]|nr:hypothetical protein [bacterium]